MAKNRLLHNADRRLPGTPNVFLDDYVPEMRANTKAVYEATGDSVKILRKSRSDSIEVDTAYADSAVGKFGSRRLVSPVSVPKATLSSARPKLDAGIVVPAQVELSQNLFRRGEVGVRTDFKPTVRFATLALEEAEVEINVVEDLLEYKGKRYRMSAAQQGMNVLDAVGEVVFNLEEVT